MHEAIRDIMTRDVESVRKDQTIREAAQVMKTRNIGSLPVIQDRKVIGMITDRDIAIRGVAEGRDPSSTRVEELMSRHIISVEEESSLVDAERLMHDRQLRRLPVLNGAGELVGYLSMAKIARTESPEQVGKVMRGVSHPSSPSPMESYEQKKRRKAQ